MVRSTPACALLLTFVFAVACGVAAPPAVVPRDTAAANVGASVDRLVIFLPRLLEDGSLRLEGVRRPRSAPEDPALDALLALIRGPNGDERARDFQYPLDPFTRVLDFRREGDHALVDLDYRLDGVHGRPYSELVYWALVFTLTEGTGVDRITLARGGVPLSHLGSPPFALPEGRRDNAPPWARPR